MYNSKDSYFLEKIVNGSLNAPRRMSNSGFEHPKDLSNLLYPTNFTSISEEKSQSSMPGNIQQSVNGAKKSEFVSPNFFSENNIHFSNQCNPSNRNMMNTTHSGTKDAGPNFNDSTSIPRFISNPLILNSTMEDSIQNNNFIDSKHFNQNIFSYDSSNIMPNSCTVTSNNMPNQYNHRMNESSSLNNQYYNNYSSNSFMPSSYLMYDPRSNSFQNVVLVPQLMQMMHQPVEMNEENQYYLQQINNARNNSNVTYPDYRNYTSPEVGNINSQYRHLENQVYLDSNGFSHDAKDEYDYDEHTDTGDEIDEIHQMESDSLHSANRNISGDSEDYTSEDDQSNTVRGDEILQELQKLSSVFTNVVNVSATSRNCNISEPVELFNNNNSSRFKKTRIEERTTHWNSKKAIVKDNLVKIIPAEVLKIPYIDDSRLDQFEDEIFGDQILKEVSDRQDQPQEQPECSHSILQRSSVFNDMRIHKHSNRNSQWCRTTTTPLSLNEFPHPSNQIHPSNISSRYASHRKSLQIPIPFPLLVNKFIPLLSPVIPHRSKPFYDQSSSKSINNNRRKRRWSVSCSRLDTGSSNSLRANGLSRQDESPRDPFNEFHEAHQSEEISDKDAHGYINSFESRIDHHLFCLKRTLLSQFDSSLRDLRSEMNSMKNTQVDLESQLRFYKTKLSSMEESIKTTLPADEWKSFGIDVDSAGS